MIKRSCQIERTDIKAERISVMVKGQKLKFVNGRVTWWIGNWTNDLEKHEQILVFKDLFRHYEFENYPLRYDSTKIESEATIKIFFVAADGYVYCEDKTKFKCPFEIDNETLAVAYAPYGGEWEGFVFINDNLFWALKDRSGEKGKYSLIDTLIHELGHTHNMGHSSMKMDLMYAIEEPGQEWGTDSKKLLWKIYAQDRLDELMKTESGLLLVNMFINDVKDSAGRSPADNLLEAINPMQQLIDYDINVDLNRTVDEIVNLKLILKQNIDHYINSKK